ncbi:MAG: hypothetical protein HY369_05145 [Candidatus Aenigmarchaeota archaeon]|nr:hypothetical protein [Candidatus Aenigmarchaeota archaeon]
MKIIKKRQQHPTLAALRRLAGCQPRRRIKVGTIGDPAKATLWLTARGLLEEYHVYAAGAFFLGGGYTPPSLWLVRRYGLTTSALRALRSRVAGQRRRAS